MAVLPVILFHAGFTAFGGGFVGVDVFFVISGYLITRILIDELARGDFSIARFYERRARRILPALFFVMLTCLPFAYMWMLPGELKEFANSLIAVVFFVSNILFLSESGYFEAAAESKPLLHTWSLAVEEQYYLIFPVFLAICWRFGRRVVLGAIVGVALASLALALWGGLGAEATFYLAPTRVWELLAGSIVAFVSGRASLANGWLSGLGLLLILAAIFGLDAATPFPSLYTIVPVLGATLIILFAGPATWVTRLLSMPAFVAIGLVSYSAYLWHQPLFAFARIRFNGAPDPGMMAVLAALSLCLAWATWRFVERPFRQRSSVFLPNRRAVFAASALAATLFVAIGLTGHISQGFKGRLGEDQRKIADFSAYPRHQYYQVGTCFLMPEQSFTDFAPECSGQGRAAIIGDSHAAALASFFTREMGFTQLTASACPPVLGFDPKERPHCADINQHIHRVIADGQAQHVLLHANWSIYWDAPDFAANLAKTIAALRDTGALPIVVGSVPQYQPSITRLVLAQGIEVSDGAQLHADQSALMDLNSELRTLAQGQGAAFWDPISALCMSQDMCPATVVTRPDDQGLGDATLIAWDYGHLTLSGAYKVGAPILDWLETLPPTG